MDSKEYLCLNNLRRYGVEVEINAFDMRPRPIGWEDGKLPEGIYYVGNLVKKITNHKVLIHKWGNDHHNECWVVKPDSSCGMEVCTPVLKGWTGLMWVCKVIDGFRQDPKISSDTRCSLHVHVDVSDLTQQQLSSVVTWWVKSEAVFLDAVPPRRKKSQYCQLLGSMDFFEDIEEGLLSPEILFKRLGHCKYYTLNTFHLHQRKRQTIEFRIMDNDCCLDPWAAKNWIRLVLHFTSQAIKRGLPRDYHEGDPWSGYCWLDPVEVFDFLGFKPGQSDLSPGLEQVRRWFLGRLAAYGHNTGLRGVMSDKGRRVAVSQIAKLSEDIGVDWAVTPDDIYSDKFRT